MSAFLMVIVGNEKEEAQNELLSEQHLEINLTDRFFRFIWKRKIFKIFSPKPLKLIINIFSIYHNCILFRTIKNFIQIFIK